MKKLKVLGLVAVAGITLASCSDDGLKTRTSFTASPSVGAVDLGAIAGYSSNPEGFTVALSNNGTVARFTCPAGEVSFITSRELTCNNASGCSTKALAVFYNPSDASDNLWVYVGETTPQNETEEFYSNNDGENGEYASGILCIPKNQVSYWS